MIVISDASPINNLAAIGYENDKTHTERSALG